MPNNKLRHLLHSLAKRWVRKPAFWAAITIVAGFLLVPSAKTGKPFSTIIEDESGALLCASIAADGQWRFPEIDSIPYKYKKCLLAFEDDYFYFHPGINPLSIARAAKQNLLEHRVVSGGSTITMQLARICRGNKERSYWGKAYEMLIALRTELRYSKSTILKKYASNAPFGGNVVGLEAAAWRYFGISPHKLSWAQSATLAVLPNSPGLIHPGRNKELLLKKRNRLLRKLYEKGLLTNENYQLALIEPLPSAPKPLPMAAPHLLTRAIADRLSGQRIATTINLALQQQATEIIRQHHERLKANEIYNAAAIIADIHTGEVKAYIGNTNAEGNYLGGKVDIITAERSYGSLLKPFLYAGLVGDGEMLPQQLVDDIPVSISGYVPQNFSRNYEGAIAADKALSRSLNIPFVILLRKYGMEKFNDLLKRQGMTTLRNPADYYGLSIILGGAEGKLWELSGMYAAMAATLSAPDKEEVSMHYSSQRQQSFPTKVFSKAATWFTLEALSDVVRPTEEGEWKMFSSKSKVAWKTGTSFGFRDAWAIGVTPRYVVGVWVGNAGGDGRPGLMGVSVAAPILFDLFGLLPNSGWFKKPEADMQVAEICPESGMKRGKYCPHGVYRHIPKGTNKTIPCPYHQLLHLDPSGQYQVTDKCISVSEMKSQPWFVLPPAQEQFYKQIHLEYKPMPPFMDGCQPDRQQASSMSIIYPFATSKMYLPKGNSRERSKLVLKAAHRDPNATIYWYVDQTFVGETKGSHTIAAQILPGRHLLLLTDSNGESISRYIEVLGSGQ